MTRTKETREVWVVEMLNATGLRWRASIAHMRQDQAHYDAEWFRRHDTAARVTRYVPDTAPASRAKGGKRTRGAK